MTMAKQQSPYLPGDVVQTTFGVGVLTSCPLSDHDAELSSRFFQARLWRIPGRSIGSSALAYLQPDSILGRLPAAPGMIAVLSGRESDEKRAMVHVYYSSKNTFLVCRTEAGSLELEEQGEQRFELLEKAEPPQWLEVTPNELLKAPTAKFYPLLDELIRRGDMAASATTGFLNERNVANLVTKTTQLVESSAGSSALSKENVENLTASVQSAIPDESHVKQVYSMLKDEELTVLLERGKERLRQLVATDIPKATEVALRKTGITVVDEDGTESSFSSSIAKSRETALSALEELLQDANVDASDVRNMPAKLEQNFTTMFDAMREAAQSDRNLNSIFDTLSGKTSEWQEASGRLLSTKSASLFLEGANRLQARAATMFSRDQLEWAGEVGLRFTRAFTEGDAAVARLKSIELGDAVRNRLVVAIEVRSGSQGGLDGIIAGALATMKGDGDFSGDQIKQMLTNLQQTASSATKDAHETLISMLSCRSQYRDTVLLQIENVLCDLETQLDEEMSAEEIAAIARGEGGTAALFEPIARRAAQEIESQLDIAESSVSDANILAVLKQVRKIMSGELSVSGLLDEVVNVLNDDHVVAAGETIIKHSENVLDAIEGVSANEVVDGVRDMAEKAGITSASVMNQMKTLNVNEILDTAQDAVTDEKARRELFSSAMDTALDFILRILPSMSVPPFDGVKDGLLYHVSNLSMEGFKVRKENIVVEIAGMRARKKAKPGAESDASVLLETRTARLESEVVDEKNDLDSSFRSSCSVDVSVHQEIPPSGKVNATELLIIDVRQISAILDDVVWSFEQTYMPYLKGKGMANVKLSDGAIRLQFELRRQRKQESNSSDQDGSEWEPVLCLHDRNCSISEVDLVLQGDGGLTWILNKLTAIFKGPLRDYVVRTIVGVLTNRSGFLLEKLNENLSPHWGMILRTAGLCMDDLMEADDKVITAAVPDENEDLVELVWRERLPLGMNLLLNDESGLLKVVEFPRGSQARAVCARRNIDPTVFDGATIVAVNGTRFDEKEELYEALKDPGRPKSILFELANSEDSERIKRFVGGSDMASRGTSQSDLDEDSEKTFSLRTMKFTKNEELGVEFATSHDGFALVVNAFHKSEDGIVFAAERQGVHLGDLLSHINGELVLGANGKGKERALSLLETVGNERPLSLSFAPPYLSRVVFEKRRTAMANIGGPEEFVLEERQTYGTSTRIVLRDFNDVEGMAEASGIMIGDHLLFINGSPVGAGCRLVGQRLSPELHEVYEMMRDESSYPVGLTFGRPRQEQASRWATVADTTFEVESAETICVTADSFSQLGCVFGGKDSDDIQLTDLFPVPGQFQEAMKSFADSNGRVSLSIESVNGQFVPSYATSSIVMNALKRSWSSNGRIEVLFCDDARKEWIEKLT